MSFKNPKGVIFNLEQIVQVSNKKEQYLSGSTQDSLQIINRRSTDNVGCAIVFDQNGQIAAIGHDDEVLAQLGLANFCELPEATNGQGGSLIPGLIDSHAHPVWAGDRVNEFDLKLRGATYLDIHRQGGGIHYTVRQTKSASEKLLKELFLNRLARFAACGTTVLECKSGYGLDYETELKMLQVIADSRLQTPIELVSTFLGAHAVPPGLTSEQGVEQVCRMIDSLAPQVDKLGVRFADVFCERGVYELKESETILNYAKEKLGCEIAFHGDELCDLGAGSMAASIGARSVSHLEFVNDESIKNMAAARVAAILCPTTCYLLRLQCPPVRQLIESSVPVVIASDYNPNAMCYSLPMAMNLAAVHYRMTPNETLAAVTLNAAYALGLSDSHGSLELGKRADCVLVDAPDWRHILYQFGDSRSVIRAVIKSGQFISNNAKP